LVVAAELATVLRCHLAMSVLRRHLGWLACLWVCSQCAVLAIAPVSLCATAPQTSDGVACTCAHGQNAECPMHHRSAPADSGCHCRNTSPDSSEATVVALFSQAGILTSVHRLVDPRTFSATVPHTTPRVAGLLPAPDGPPPRS